MKWWTAISKIGSDISIATIPVADREAPEFGILKTNDEGYITSFIEKPKKEILPEWASDTGDEMKHQGRELPCLNGYLYF